MSCSSKGTSGVLTAAAMRAGLPLGVARDFFHAAQETIVDYTHDLPTPTAAEVGEWLTSKKIDVEAMLHNPGLSSTDRKRLENAWKSLDQKQAALQASPAQAMPRTTMFAAWQVMEPLMAYVAERGRCADCSEYPRPGVPHICSASRGPSARPHPGPERPAPAMDLRELDAWDQTASAQLAAPPARAELTADPAPAPRPPQHTPPVEQDAHSFGQGTALPVVREFQQRCPTCQQWTAAHIPHACPGLSVIAAPPPTSATVFGSSGEHIIVLDPRGSDRGDSDPPSHGRELPDSGPRPETQAETTAPLPVILVPDQPAPDYAWEPEPDGGAPGNAAAPEQGEPDPRGSEHDDARQASGRAQRGRSWRPRRTPVGRVRRGALLAGVGVLTIGTVWFPLGAAVMAFMAWRWFRAERAWKAKSRTLR